MAITSWSSTVPVVSEDAMGTFAQLSDSISTSPAPALVATTTFIHWPILAGSGATYGLLWPRADQTVVYIDPKPFDADYLLTLGE